MIKLQCVIYYQWIRLNELYKLMKSFFQISISKPKNIQTTRILIKVQCINRIFEYFSKTKKYSNHENIDQSTMYYISTDSTRQALQTNGKLFFQNQESFLELVQVQNFILICQSVFGFVLSLLYIY